MDKQTKKEFQQEMEHHHFEETVKEGKAKLHLLAEIGRVAIQTHPHSTIIVNAETRHMDVSVEKENNTVHVRVEQQDKWLNWLSRISKLLSGEHPKAKITVHVPADCQIKAKTVTGTMSIQDVDAPVTARVVTGQSKLKNIGGPIYAKTVTGTVSYQGVLSNEQHRFETVTGELHLKLKKEPNAQIDIRTVTGRVLCDFPLHKKSQQQHFVGGKIKGMLGSGEGQIKARVVTGNLHLAQANS